MKPQTHYPFLYISPAFCLGIILSRFVQLPYAGLCILTILLWVLGTCSSKRMYLPTILTLVAITGLGAVYTQGRKQISVDDITHIARYYRGKTVNVKGRVISDIQEHRAVNGFKSVFSLQLDEVETQWGWRKKKGKILVNIFNGTEIAYGDYLMIRGKLHRPYNFSSKNNFSYSDYLARRDIYYILSVKKSSPVNILARGKGSKIRSLSLRIRGKLKRILTKHLSANESGIMSAILLGDRTAINKAIRTLFVQTGTAHILAISGLHMGIIAALFLGFCRMMPFGRRLQLSVVICLIVGYVFLTGGRPSVVRAAVMTTVFLASYIIEKEFHVLNTLCLAALVILLINPSNLFDVGFQLSFVCVFAIIYTDLNIKKLREDRMAKNGSFINGWKYFLFRSIYISLAIWISVSGLIAYYFGIITPVTILANLIVVPLISAVVTLGFGLLFMGVFFPPWAVVFATYLKIVLNIMVAAIFLSDKIPLAHIYVKGVNLWHVVVYYLILLVFIAFGPIYRSSLKGQALKMFKSTMIDKPLRV